MSDGSAPLVVGVYSQPYNEIVKPDQIWPVSKYFLRRWTPYLNPTRFWTIIAARQLAYRLGNKRRFECYDKLLYQEACTSRANFYRIKAELEEKDTALSLFISRAPIKYRRQGDVTKPGPTIYNVRLDDVLTPADATYLTTWFQSQKIKRQSSEVLALLQQAKEFPVADLLAPSLTPYLNDLPAKFQPITVADIIARVYGPKIAQQTEVRQAADALHTHLTGGTYIGTQYFRKEWVKLLGSGPAVLLTFLRSQCFLNENTGELRNEVTFTKPQLADALGIDKATLFRWLKKIDAKTPKNQPFFPFLELLSSHKTAANEVETTYRVQLYDPLTKPHLEKYLEQIKDNSVETAVSTPQLQNGTHTSTLTQKPELQNEIHTSVETMVSALQNETDTNEESRSSELQNETHTSTSIATLDPHPQPTLQNETTNIAKWDSNKYLTTLIRALTNKEISTDTAAHFSLPDNLHQPFWETAVSDINHFCQLVNIQGRHSRKVLEKSNLSLDQLVAWVLYAQTQNGITPQMLPGYLVNRAREQERPPAEFSQLANLSAELWFCFGSLLLLPPKHHDNFEGAPCYDIWMHHYGQMRPEQLPFGVGEAIQSWLSSTVGIEETQASIEHVSQEILSEAQTIQNDVSEPPATIHCQEPLASKQWQIALHELEMQMTKATFNTLLRDSQFLRHEGQTYTIGVPTEHAQAWLSHRLYPTVQRTFSSIMEEAIDLTFEVVEFA